MIRARAADEQDESRRPFTEDEASRWLWSLDGVSLDFSMVMSVTAMRLSEVTGLLPGSVKVAGNVAWVSVQKGKTNGFHMAEITRRTPQKPWGWRRWFWTGFRYGPVSITETQLASTHRWSLASPHWGGSALTAKWRAGMESTSTLDETRLYDETRLCEVREGVKRLLEDAKRTADTYGRRDLLARALRLAVWAEQMARGW
jgi:hypothetical protein